ncbi:MAG: hypothetical protein K9L64_04335 [Candidatus Izimaplasma sp.]|nr:hypothetical protein [Candidatus Izimaplasma bacterium]
MILSEQKLIKNLYLQIKSNGILLEGQNEDQALNKLKKANQENVYERLLKLTSPYKDTQAGKNNKHLPKLVDFYLNEHISLQQIEIYYTKFIKNTTINQKDISKMSFIEFSELVDTTVTKLNVANKDIIDKPINEDDNVKIYLGDSQEKCIQYGQGTKYGFCISADGAGNAFHTYRRLATSFYFIYFNKPNQNAKEGFIVLQANPDNKFKINYATTNQDIDISWEELINKFPELKNKKDILKNIPLSSEEKHLYDTIFKADSILKLTNIDDKIMYVKLGKEIKDTEFDQMNDKVRNTILETYIEVGMYDVPLKYIENDKKLMDRYIKKLSQRFDIKIKNNYDSFTPHELEFATEEQKQLAVKRYGSAIKYIKNPSEELQKLAVKQNANFIQYIKNPSEKVQQLAVQQNAYALQVIENPSEELQKLAVQQNGYAIQVIENPSEEVQKLAVQQNGDAIRDIIENGITPSEEVQKLAVQQYGYAIQYIKNPSEKVQQLAVQENGEAIYYIIDNGITPSEAVIRIAKRKGVEI